MHTVTKLHSKLADKTATYPDALSRLPLNEAPDDVPLPGDTVSMLEALDSSGPVTTAAIKSGTDKDPILSRVRNFVFHGKWVILIYILIIPVRS